jgi:co-chaperonin GroES (HSP10)
MPSRSDRDAVELEQSVTLDDRRPQVGVDPEDVETSVTPFDDWILLRMDPPQQSTRGGILIGDQSVPESRLGVIVKQGEGLLLPDGKGRALMYAGRGDRVLIERRGGKTMPGVPDETRTGQTGYLLVRNGSLVCRIRRGARPRSDGAPFIKPEDVQPFADWTMIQMDRPRDTARSNRPRPTGVLAPALVLPQRAQAAQTDRSDTWTGTIMSAGPGRLKENGVEYAQPRARVGARVLLTNTLLQTVPGVDGYVLALEREVVVAQVGA